MIEPEAPKSVLTTLGINGPLFLAQLINFSIVVLVMWRWVYRPLVRLMDERTKQISDGLAHAKQADERLVEADTAKNRLLQSAKQEAHTLLERAREQAEEFRKQKLQETKTEIEKIAIEAKGQIREERDAAFTALQGDVANLVVEATKKLIGHLDEKAHHGFIERAVKDLERT